MNLKKNIKRLETENLELKLEVSRLKLDLAEMSGKWRHPNSCLYNSDPWKHLK